jgi:hypothetical protein
MTALRLLRIAAALAFASAVAAGCTGSGRIDIYTCDDPCGNGQPGHTCEDPCGECRGQCVPLPPFGFDGPALLWFGSKSEAPECPVHAPIYAYEGYADLDASFECPPCECSEPACALPSGLTASTNGCPGGAIETHFDAPTNWSGSCTSPATVPSNLLESLSVEPATVRPCEPVAQPVPQNWELFPTWKQFARACKGTVTDGLCRDPGMTCEPTAEPPPPGFRQCIIYLRDGEPECPSTYPEKFTFYSGLEDTRECTPCECTETVPSLCSAWVSIFQNDDCSAPLLSTGIDNSATSAACFPVAMQGAQLGSMEATWVDQLPGACAPSGGHAVGEAKPVAPSTFCCQSLAGQSGL